MKRKIIKLVLLLSAVLVLAGCGAGVSSKEQGAQEGNEKSAYHKITAEDAKTMIDEGGVTIVDVRTQDEYNEAHIKDAVLLPLDSIGSEPPEELPDKDAVLLIYCRSGRRSRQASNKLVEMGYSRVYDFGGINDWPYETERVDLGTITDLFLNPHDEPELEKEADLNGDGALEKITLTRLPYNGGDGGYLLKVFKEQGSSELSLPEAYDNETGFPYYVKWDGKQIQIFAGQECIAELNAKQVQEIYQNKGMADVLEKSKGRPEEIAGDAVSGFTVVEEDNQSGGVLMVKSYLSGLGGRSDCIGYGIARLLLDGDDRWNVEYSFLPDEYK